MTLLAGTGQSLALHAPCSAEEGDCVFALRANFSCAGGTFGLRMGYE